MDEEKIVLLRLVNGHSLAIKEHYSLVATTVLNKSCDVVEFHYYSDGEPVIVFFNNITHIENVNKSVLMVQADPKLVIPRGN